jgi:hypothetical protein
MLTLHNQAGMFSDGQKYQCNLLSHAVKASSFLSENAHFQMTI